MRILVTTSRMPAAIDEIRKLGKRGHSVFASDTFPSAPGSHSKYLMGSRVTAWPRETQRFIADVREIVSEERIEMVLPAFEEAFFLAKHVEVLSSLTKVFLPSFNTLQRLHDKAKLAAFARELGVRAPETIVVSSAAELRHAAAELGEYFARPAYSRGGVQLLTNVGSRAADLQLDECEPTPERPWVVQEFVHGIDVCTFSIAHHGRITGHSAYLHPREIEHTGGIVFESVHEFEALSVAQKLVEATDYDGQVAFDFLKTESEMVLIECNPRPTAGVHLMSSSMFEAALLDWEGQTLRVAPPGVRRKYSVALLRNMLLHARELPTDLRYLVSRAREVFAEPGDLLPALYQAISYGHVLQYRRDLQLGQHSPKDLLAAYFYDVCWDGDPIE